MVCYTIRQKIYNKMISCSNQIKSTKKDHPNQTELNPIIRLRKVVNGHEANKDIQNEHDEDHGHQNSTDEANSFAEALVKRFQEINHDAPQKSVESVSESSGMKATAIAMAIMMRT